MKIKFRSPIMMLLCITLIFMALLTVRPSVTYACSCVVPDEPLVALEKSTAVFAGKVVKMKEPKGIIISSADSVTVTFEVDSSWKGVLGDKVSLTTELSSASCGFEFMDGESYLVYAYARGKGDSDELTTGLCSRTVLLSSAGEDLKELGPSTYTGTAEESPESTMSASPTSGAETDAGAGNNGTSVSARNAAAERGPFTLLNVGISGVIVVLIAIVAAVLYRRKK